MIQEETFYLKHLISALKTLAFGCYFLVVYKMESFFIGLAILILI